jgi:hypothetical protein
VSRASHQPGCCVRTSVHEPSLHMPHNSPGHTVVWRWSQAGLLTGAPVAIGWFSPFLRERYREEMGALHSTQQVCGCMRSNPCCREIMVDLKLSTNPSMQAGESQSPGGPAPSQSSSGPVACAFEPDDPDFSGEIDIGG